MARRSRKSEPEPLDEDEATVSRDFIIARIGIAISEMDQARAALTDALAMFVSTDDDKTGKERAELVDAAIEHASNATRALELAQDNLDEYDPSEGEPWESEDE